MSVESICALCKRARELRDSHFIPKSIFKEIRLRMAKDLSSPISVDRVRNKSFVSDEQPKTHLLCADCENKFSKKGERSVIAELRRRTGFRLRDEIIGDRDGIRARELVDFPALNFMAYAYFAISVVWRGAAYSWPSPYHLMTGKLGPHQENLRSWLDCEDKFPEKIYVEIVVDRDDTSPPLGGPNISEMNDLGSMRVFQFITLGVWFRVHVDGFLNEKGMDAFRNGPVPIAFRKTSFKDFGITDLALEEFRRTKPTGKLKKVMLTRPVLGVR